MSEPVKTVVNPVRRGTVVWGVILVITAGVSYALTRVNFTFDPGQASPRILIFVIVGVGALLIFAAIFGAVLRSFRRNTLPPPE